jgi:hypothetical protein
VHHVLRACLVALTLIACTNYVGDTAAASTTVGPQAVFFTAKDGIPAHGPRNTVTFYLAPQYDNAFIDRAPHVVIKGPDRVIVVLHAVVVFTDGTRRTLHPSGYDCCARGLTYRRMFRCPWILSPGGVAIRGSCLTTRRIPGTARQPAPLRDDRCSDVRSHCPVIDTLARSCYRCPATIQY